MLGPLRATGRTRDLVLFLDRQIYGLTFHWIAWANLALALYVLPAIAAPLLLAGGHAGASELIYTLYGPPVCHQLPERSFFFLGPRLAYSAEELSASGVSLPADPGQRRLFVGEVGLGYKMAFCQRDLALYGGAFLFGALYAVLRRRLKPLGVKGLLLFLAPLAVDGTLQILRLHESTPALRLMTGLLAAAGGVWFLYPIVDLSMLDLRRKAAAKLKLPA
jgi:uncharacterized membrane protein